LAAVVVPVGDAGGVHAAGDQGVLDAGLGQGEPGTGCESASARLWAYPSVSAKLGCGLTSQERIEYMDLSVNEDTGPYIATLVSDLGDVPWSVLAAGNGAAVDSVVRRVIPDAGDAGRPPVAAFNSYI
jgi:hypothetical protein